MILSRNAFDAQRDVVNAIVFNETTIVKLIHNRTMNYFDKDYYIENYRENFKSFPVFTIAKADEITIEQRVVLNFKRYYNTGELAIADGDLKKQIPNEDSDSLRMDIDDLIEDKLHNLFYSFNDHLADAKASFYFAGVTDTVIIIKNLINHYINVLNDKNIQLVFFTGLQLTKEMADLLTTIYLEVLKDKLAMLEIKDVNELKEIPISRRDDYKITWKGKQQDVLELFVELQRKNWIGPLNEISLKRTAVLLCDMFDLSETKRNGDSDTVESIYTLLKGEYDAKKTKKFKFEKEGYKRKFSEIGNNG